MCEAIDWDDIKSACGGGNMFIAILSIMFIIEIYISKKMLTGNKLIGFNLQ
jgi:hypothetical protein